MYATSAKILISLMTLEANSQESKAQPLKAEWSTPNGPLIMGETMLRTSRIHSPLSSYAKFLIKIVNQAKKVEANMMC